MKRPSILIVSALVVASLTVGCSRRQQEWETARTADNIQGYETFLKSFPDGEFTSQAQARVKELQEAQDWQQAIMTDTPEAYRKFLEHYPSGRMSDEARIRVENFALAQTPAPGSEGAAPGEEGLPPQVAVPMEAPPEEPAPVQNKAPTPPALPPAHDASPAKTPAAPSSGSGYRIQLGAFAGGDKQAMAEWRRLKDKYPKQLSNLSPSVKLATTSAGHVYRLQAGKTTEARAREICSALKAKGQACVVVLP